MPGWRRRPTSAANVSTSGTLDGNIIATIIRTQPRSNRPTSRRSDPGTPS
jgi:hypothetical protein